MGRQSTDSVSQSSAVALAAGEHLQAVGQGRPVSYTHLDVYKRQDVGYLPSENSYYENMKVRELLQYTADLYGMDCKTKMKELADRLNLDLSRKIADLSLGNRCV